MPEDEQPPEEIHGDDVALVKWFDEVKKEREAKYSPKGSEPLEEVPLMQNEVELPDWLKGDVGGR